MLCIIQALNVGVQVSGMMPQHVAMGGMGFQNAGSVVSFSMFALKLLTGANQSLMVVFEGCSWYDARRSTE